MKRSNSLREIIALRKPGVAERDKPGVCEIIYLNIYSAGERKFPYHQPTAKAVISRSEERSLSESYRDVSRHYK